MKQSSLQIAASHGHKVKIFEAKEIIPFILQHPTAIFEGIRNEDDETWSNDCAGWRCYCGQPTIAFDQNGNKTNPPPKKVYLVFINDNKIIYEWRWEEESSDKPGYPTNHDERFRELLL